MYRLLAAAGENRERRRQRTHPAKKKPELIAEHPNQIWSWELHTPASVHYGTATEIRAQRAVTLDAAYTANPGRFRHQRPTTPSKLPTVSWINEPS